MKEPRLQPLGDLIQCYGPNSKAMTPADVDELRQEYEAEIERLKEEISELHCDVDRLMGNLKRAVEIGDDAERSAEEAERKLKIAVDALKDNRDLWELAHGDLKASANRAFIVPFDELHEPIKKIDEALAECRTGATQNVPTSEQVSTEAQRSHAEEAERKLASVRKWLTDITHLYEGIDESGEPAIKTAKKWAAHAIAEIEVWRINERI
jgi:DNA-binding transcriptional MerR regulator